MAWQASKKVMTNDEEAGNGLIHSDGIECRELHCRRDATMANTPSFSAADNSDPRCHQDFQVSCSSCRLATICLPIALEAVDIDKLDKIIQRGRPLQKGEHIYREGDPFTSVYAVRAGALSNTPAELVQFHVGLCLAEYARACSDNQAGTRRENESTQTSVLAKG